MFSEQALFKSLLLEILQAGLRWELILKKQNALEMAFDDFNEEQLAEHTKFKIRSLLLNSNIIRNHYKISAIIENAKLISSLKKRGVMLEKLTWQPVNYVQLDHLRAPCEQLDCTGFTKRFFN